MADPAGKARRKMAITIAIRQAKWGPSLVPILESLTFSEDEDVGVLGVAVEIFVKIAASGEEGDSPSSSVQTQKGTIQS